MRAELTQRFWQMTNWLHSSAAPTSGASCHRSREVHSSVVGAQWCSARTATLRRRQDDGDVAIKAIAAKLSQLPPSSALGAPRRRPAIVCVPWSVGAQLRPRCHPPPMQMASNNSQFESHSRRRHAIHQRTRWTQSAAIDHLLLRLARNPSMATLSWQDRSVCCLRRRRQACQATEKEINSREHWLASVISRLASEAVGSASKSRRKEKANSEQLGC